MGGLGGCQMAKHDVFLWMASGLPGEHSLEIEAHSQSTERGGHHPGASGSVLTVVQAWVDPRIRLVDAFPAAETIKERLELHRDLVPEILLSTKPC